VTFVLPFGETIAASFESDLGLWTGRFLIPADAEEGSYPIEVLVTHADGRIERLRVWYTVDASGAVLEVETIGDARPGATVMLRARQIITESDLEMAGLRADAELTEARAQILSDARDVSVRAPSGEVTDMTIAGPGLWEATLTIPENARGTYPVDLVIVDLAANVSTQPHTLELR
jgi:hypothetical protein